MSSRTFIYRQNHDSIVSYRHTSTQNVGDAAHKDSNKNIYQSSYLHIESENSWEYLRISERKWEYLRISENIWEYLRISENIWEYLRESENIWEYLRISENIWEKVRISENIWEKVRISENIWEYLREVSITSTCFDQNIYQSSHLHDKLYQKSKIRIS